VEGARVHHVVASYLHGSMLPKNPAVADHLIRAAVERRFGSFDAEPLDDTLAERARAVAVARPR
jgi:CobQ-like glutamine amidotransferase family enzyme